MADLSTSATLPDPSLYQIVTADMTYVYAVDDQDFPVDVLSSHTEIGAAWTAFYEAVAAEESTSEIIFLHEISAGVVDTLASSDDLHLIPEPIHPPT